MNALEAMVQDEFRRRKYRMLIARLLLAAIWVIGTYGALRIGGATWFVPTAAALTGFWFDRREWRCPACNTHLGVETSPMSCPRCRIVLQQ